MKLSDLIDSIDGREVRGSTAIDVAALACHADEVVPGGAFVALRGAKADGHAFVPEAIQRGACAVVVDRSIEVPAGVTAVIVPETRRALAAMAARFYGDASKRFALVGITGTNGKTTITYLLESIAEAAGKRPGVIGTVAYRFGATTIPAPHTTPESLDLQRLFQRMAEAKVELCAIEVSSHALVQQRVAGAHFDAAIFTNLTPEHLDYHRCMEEYFAAKAILFEQLLASSAKLHPFAVINADDPYGRELVARCPVAVVRYGLREDAEVRGTDLRIDASGLTMQVTTPAGGFACRSRLCGRFNAQNILAAIAAAQGLGIPLATIAQGIAAVRGVPGRFEAVANDRGVLALVDYAHTPDALENVLGNARDLLRNGARLIAVFGCGGDRDRAKRPLMGAAAGRLADVAIVTSDNPRTEDPAAIIDEILPGVREAAQPFADGKGYEVVPDRRAAIERATLIAKAGDVIVVAGKGHEDYQIIGTQRFPFDDRLVLQEMLER